MALDIIYVLIALALLWKGSDWLVDSAVNLASRLGVSQLIIGLTVVALGTSAPEFVVTVGAVLNGQAALSISNIIGSNVFNLGFIMGGVAMFRTIDIPDKLVRRDGLILILMSVAIFLMMLNLHFGRLEGIVLFGGFAAYMGLLLFQKREVDHDIVHKRSLGVDILVLLLGMGMIMAGGSLLREGAVGIARAAGLSEWIIGATIVAIGTSAPEFATSLIAAVKGHHGMSVGNLVGSCIFNGLGVLGVAGMLKPIVITAVAWQSALLLLVLVVTAVIMLKTRKQLSKAEGFVLVMLSLGIYVVQILLE